MGVHRHCDAEFCQIWFLWSFKKETIFIYLWISFHFHMAILLSEIFFDKKKTTRICMSKFFAFLSKVKGAIKISTVGSDWEYTIWMAHVFKDVIQKGFIAKINFCLTNKIVSAKWPMYIFEYVCQATLPSCVFLKSIFTSTIPKCKNKDTFEKTKQEHKIFQRKELIYIFIAWWLKSKAAWKY